MGGSEAKLIANDIVPRGFLLEGNHGFMDMTAGALRPEQAKERVYADAVGVISLSLRRWKS